ncbi:hypothetical protein ONE63_006401 [Megalurothrips usitatus]|uniref:Gustatory receptor n=1 Tax=Megalurothrips usitatus TaxID=439358 RepID=A0AAV7XX80_9NEOP|nr:hypothetical protein ONE63_006401 [Megalurothrips usitatus]
MAAVCAVVSHVVEEALYPPNYSINAYGATRLVTSTTMALDSAVSAAAVLHWGWGSGRRGLRQVLAAPEVRDDAAPRCRGLLVGLAQHSVTAAVSFATFFVGGRTYNVPPVCTYLMLGVVVDDVLTSMMVELFAALLWVVHDRFKALNESLSQSLARRRPSSPRSWSEDGGVPCGAPETTARSWGPCTNSDPALTSGGADRSREVAAVRRLHKSAAVLLRCVCEAFGSQLLYRCLSLCCCGINFPHYHVHAYVHGTLVSSYMRTIYGVARVISTAVCVARAFSAASAVTREGNRVVDIILQLRSTGHLTRAESEELRNFSTQLHQSPVCVKMMRTIALDLRLVVGAASTTAGYVAVLIAFDQT